MHSDALFAPEHFTHAQQLLLNYILFRILFFLNFD